MNEITENMIEAIRVRRKNPEAVMTLKTGVVQECLRVSSLIPAFDIMLGGGVPTSRILEIYGEEGSGKTTMGLHILSGIQSAGGVAMFIDVENSLDLSYASQIVDIDELIFSQPNSAEEAMEIVNEAMDIKQEAALEHEKNVKDGKPSSYKPYLLGIVIDSAAALCPEQELKGEIGDVTVSTVARFLSTVLRRMKSLVRTSETILIFTNQVRDSIGGWRKESPSTAGRALKFYSSIRIELSNRGMIKQKDKFIGQTIHAKTIKNKTFPPFTESYLRVIWGKGVDKHHSLFTSCVESEIISRKGAWFNFGSTYSFQGEEGFISGMKDDKILSQLLCRKLMALHDIQRNVGKLWVP